MAPCHTRSGTVDKIVEIVETGTLSRLETLDTPEERARQLFVKIWGVGSASANKLVDQGHRTLEDLKIADSADPRVLTRVQKIGLRYFDEIEVYDDLPNTRAAA